MRTQLIQISQLVYSANAFMSYNSIRNASFCSSIMSRGTWARKSEHTGLGESISLIFEWCKFFRNSCIGLKDVLRFLPIRKRHMLSAIFFWYVNDACRRKCFTSWLVFTNLLRGEDLAQLKYCQCQITINHSFIQARGDYWMTIIKAWMFVSTIIM